MITPPKREFGSVTIGSSSAASTFSITNNGDGDSVALTTSIDGDDFAIDSAGCDGKTLAPRASCDIAVVFSPTAGGAATGTLTVGYGEGTVSATLEGTGLEVGALAVTPTPHDYGDVLVEASERQVFTVTNDGGAQSGTITASIGGDDATEFSIPTDECSNETLAPGATCAVTIDFSPTSAGPKTTTLTVSDGVGDPATVGLSGAGLDDAAVEVAPVSGDFGTVTVGTTSDDSTFTVTNTGEVASGTLGVALSGDDAAAFGITTDNCKDKTLAADATCTIEVHFAPTTVGAQTASLDISGTPGGAASSSLTGESVAPGQLEISPNPHDFGETLVDATGSSQTFTVTNSGGSATGTLTTTVNDSNASSFVIGSDDCVDGTLAAGATCTISVTFSPQTAGSLSASLNVSATPGGSVTAAMSGTGVAPAALAIDPTTHDFGSVGLDDPESFSFTVTNTGDADTGTPTVGFTAGEISQFQLSHNCSTALAGGDSCIIDVTYDPATTERHSVSLTASASPGGSVDSLIEGQGVDSASLSFQSGGSIAFDETVVDYEAPAQLITVINRGDLETGTIAVSLGGDNAADFSITDDTCDGSRLASGATCQITVAFAPQSPGAKSAAVSLTADPGSDISAALSGPAIDKLLIVGNTADDDGSFDTPVKVGNEATQTFLLENNGEVRDLTVTIDPPDAGFVSAPAECLDVADGASCTIDVTFTADENTNEHTATLNVNGNGAVTSSATLDMSAIVEGALVITSPTLPHDFGGVETGEASSQVFTIENQGGTTSGTITTTVPTTDDFTMTDDQCSGLDLTAGENCTIEVTFAPTVAGDLTDSFTAEASAGTVVANFEGTGLRPARLVISGQSFGHVIITDSATRVYSVNNPGDVDATGLATALPGDEAYSITDNTCDTSTTLAAGASCTVTVEFAPSAGSSPGRRTGSLEATADGGLSDDFPFRGTAVSQLTVTPLAHTFPDTVEGETSSAQTFTVENIGTESVSGISTFADRGDTAAFEVSNVDCGSLAAGAQCTFEVSFAPTSDASFTALVTAAANQGATASATVDGTGITQATVEANPSSFNFGGVVAGSVSESQAVTFTNVGDATTGTLAATLESTFDFAIVSDGCSGASLAAGTSCDVVVRFEPDETTTGSVATVLNVEDGSGSAAATLSGTALEPSANLIFDPTFATFPDTVEGESSDVQAFALTNNAEISLTVTFDVVGAGFSVASTDCGTSLADGSTCTVDVRFEPIFGEGAVAYEAEIIARSNDPNVDDGVLAVRGEATAAPAVR